MAGAYNLELLNVLWEDTGRWEGSSVGPNISDVTIEVEGYSKGKTHRSYLMPVMRHDNYVDKTADVKIDKILIPVGNQAKAGQLELISLTELLQDPTRYMSTPRTRGRSRRERCRRSATPTCWSARSTRSCPSPRRARRSSGR